MKNFARAALGLAFSALTACSSVPVTPERAVPGDLHFTSKDVFYDIAGPSSADIARQLDEHSRRNDGRLAETRWNLRTELNFRGVEGGGCRMAKIDVKVDIEVELPRWQGAEQSLLRDRWQDFQNAARVHEKGHYDHALAAGSEVASALRDLAAEDCDALGKVAAARTQALVDKYNALDEQYDAETRHGILQGTVWRYE